MKRVKRRERKGSGNRRAYKKGKKNTIIEVLRNSKSSGKNGKEHYVCTRGFKANNIFSKGY